MWAARAARDNTEAHPREIQIQIQKKKTTFLFLLQAVHACPALCPFHGRAYSAAAYLPTAAAFTISLSNPLWVVQQRTINLVRRRGSPNPFY